ncbi:IS3 family transposase [Fusobacterium varium]
MLLKNAINKKKINYFNRGIKIKLKGLTPVYYRNQSLLVDY